MMWKSQLSRLAQYPNPLRLLLPIDFPVLSDNAGVALKEAPRSNDKLLAFGSVHPWTSKVGDGRR